MCGSISAGTLCENRVTEAQTQMQEPWIKSMRFLFVLHVLCGTGCGPRCRRPCCIIFMLHRVEALALGVATDGVTCYCNGMCVVHDPAEGYYECMHTISNAQNSADNLWSVLRVIKHMWWDRSEDVWCVHNLYLLALCSQIHVKVVVNGRWWPRQQARGWVPHTTNLTTLFYYT